MEEEMEEVGKIIHYYPKINVAVVELKKALTLREKIYIKGSTTDLEQTVESMQIEHEEIPKAVSGQSIGLKVEKRVREGDIVYKIL